MSNNYTRHESVTGEAIGIFIAVLAVVCLFIWTNQFAGRYSANSPQKAASAFANTLDTNMSLKSRPT